MPILRSRAQSPDWLSSTRCSVSSRLKRTRRLFVSTGTTSTMESRRLLAAAVDVARTGDKTPCHQCQNCDHAQHKTRAATKSEISAKFHQVTFPRRTCCIARFSQPEPVLFTVTAPAGKSPCKSAIRWQVTERRDLCCLAGGAGSIGIGIGCLCIIAKTAQLALQFGILLVHCGFQTREIVS